MPLSRASCRPWTTLELKQLRESRQLGAQAVAELLGRSITCVKSAASRAGISLRRPGSRRGLVLGQPRACSLRPDVRDDLVGGRVSAEVVRRRMDLEAEAALCPTCARRSVEGRTGECRVCHLRRLTEAHCDALEAISCQQALWTSRQALKRARDGRQHVVVLD